MVDLIKCTAENAADMHKLILTKKKIKFMPDAKEFDNKLMIDKFKIDVIRDIIMTIGLVEYVYYFDHEYITIEELQDLSFVSDSDSIKDLILECIRRKR